MKLGVNMKALLILFAVYLVMPSGVSFGHSDHHHGPAKAATESEVQKSAKQQIDRLIANKKLDPSWQQASLDSVAKKAFKKQTEWVVTFSNKAIKDQAKAKLYVFFNLTGTFLAANHTGN